MSEIVVFKNSGVVNGHAYVDLGLPSGLKWATCNVGATNPWDYGDYFAWGEIKPKNVYHWDTYGYGKRDQLTKYVSGYFDEELAAEDDAATMNMGGFWRMPTTDEQDELMENCYWEWTSNYNGSGVSGYIIYKAKNLYDRGAIKNDEKCPRLMNCYTLSDIHIFLPAAGVRKTNYKEQPELYNVGSLGVYWSSSLVNDSTSDALCQIFFAVSSVHWNDVARCNGLSVRGVHE